MNNNMMRFDPMTGKPLDQNNAQPNQPMPDSQAIPNQVTNNMAQVQQNVQPNANLNPQQQLQSIPTVGQDMQQFINNAQTNSESKKQKKKSGPNIAFIIILFAIIFVAIFFVFPYLLEVL